MDLVSLPAGGDFYDGTLDECGDELDFLTFTALVLGLPNLGWEPLHSGARSSNLEGLGMGSETCSRFSPKLNSKVNTHDNEICSFEVLEDLDLVSS